VHFGRPGAAFGLLPSLGKKTFSTMALPREKPGLAGAPAELLDSFPARRCSSLKRCAAAWWAHSVQEGVFCASRAIGAQLFEQIQRLEGEVVACGVSCRSQIEMGTGRKVTHPVEVLARAMGL